MASSIAQEGGCRCGRVRFRVSAPPLLTSACHCTGCQRMTASAFSLSVAVPSDGFAVIQGEPVLGGLQSDAQHYFCAFCKSWMFTRMPGMDQFVNVRATSFDDPIWATPFVEMYTSEKLAWVTTPARYSFEKFPPMDAFEGLVRDYVSANSSSVHAWQATDANGLPE